MSSLYLPVCLTLYYTVPKKPWENAFENIVGKEENAGNQRFLLFPHCFLPIIISKTYSITVSFFD